MEYILPALVSTENNISRRVSVDVTSIFAGFHKGGGGTWDFPSPKEIVHYAITLTVLF